VAQSVVLGLTVVAAGMATFFFNDGRDNQLKRTTLAAAVIGATGTVLFFVGEALTAPASAVPRCEWTDVGNDLSPRCESSGEASRRAAEQSLDHLTSGYLLGPALEGAATLGGAAVGLAAAMVTRRAPSDGRRRRLLIDDD
jgi:hypothetical protein